MPEVRRRSTGTEYGRINEATTGGTSAGGGFFDQFQRMLLGGSAAGDQTATSTSTVGTATTYETSGSGTITLSDLPAGDYIVEARHRLVYDVDCTDQYHRVDIDSKPGDNGGAAATAGLPLVCTCTAFVAVGIAGGAITATPTMSGGPGAGHVTVEETTLTATRIVAV